MFENTKIQRWYRWCFVEMADPRTSVLPLMQNPFPLMGIMLVYALFVLKWGPALMKNRKPFKLQKFMVLYNALQVVLSAVMLFPGIYWCYIFGTYSWTCEPVDRSRSPLALKIAYTVYFYFISKLTELLDTIFFVLRKKDRQISFLHVSHHVSMPFVGWCCAKYFPGGQFIFSGWLNCFVHTVMYTYYMISAMGPQYQKYLWWKKYITTMQLTQFVLGAGHLTLIFFFNCGQPKWILVFLFPNFFMYFSMFKSFYDDAYKKKQDQIEANKALLATKANGIMKNGTNGITSNEINNNEIINSNGKAKVQ